MKTKNSNATKSQTTKKTGRVSSKKIVLPKDSWEAGWSKAMEVALLPERYDYGGYHHTMGKSMTGVYYYLGKFSIGKSHRGNPMKHISEFSKTDRRAMRKAIAARGTFHEFLSSLLIPKQRRQINPKLTHEEANEFNDAYSMR